MLKVSSEEVHPTSASPSVSAKESNFRRISSLKDSSQAETDKRRRSIRYRAKRKAQPPVKNAFTTLQGGTFILPISGGGSTHTQTDTASHSKGIRWQIELMFKGFKSIGKLQHVSEVRNPIGSWLKSMPNSSFLSCSSNKPSCSSAGYRHIHHSFIKTARYIAGYARLIALSFHHSKTALRKTLKAIKQAFDEWRLTFQRSTGKNTTFHRLKEATENP